MIALTGSGNPEFVLLNNVNGNYGIREILRNSDRRNPYQEAIGLSGFRLSYDSDHHIRNINVGISKTAEGIDIINKMEDASRHTNRDDDRDRTRGCYLAYFGTGSGLTIKPFSLSNGEQIDSGLGETDNYGIIINKFDLEFAKSDHHFKCLEAGAKLTGDRKIEGILRMEDDDGNRIRTDCEVSGYLISYMR